MPFLRRHATIWPELLFSGLVLTAWCLVWPVGEYAVNDDWAFIRSLQILLDESKVRILDWNPMSLVAHLAWGALVCGLVGFSMTTTKLATALLAWLAGLATIRAMRRLGAAPCTSFWVAASPAPRAASGNARLTLARTVSYARWWPRGAARLYVYRVDRSP